MSVKGTFAGACAFLLLLSISQPVAPQEQQAELPTWNVGDTWAMGARDINLTPIFAAVAEALNTMPGFSYDMTGEMSYYMVYEVATADAQQYRVDVDAGAEMTMSISMSGSMDGQQVSSSTSMTMTVKMDGALYFTKDNLALTQVYATMDGDIAFSTSGTGLGIPGSGSVDMSANMTVTFDPALNLFDFPISVDNSWEIQSTATITGNMSMKVSMPGVMENSVDIPLNATTDISITANCQGTEDFTLPDGSTTTAYKLVYPSPYLMSNPLIPAGTVYYSPDARFIIAEELSFSDAMGGMMPGGKESLAGITLGATSIENDQPLFSLSPMSEQEARSAIAGLGERGIDMVLVAIVVAVVVVVVLAALLIWRKRAVSA